jgi:predicted nucleic acid-binding protein
MIIADTSMWMAFFKKEQPTFDLMRKKLELGEIYVLESVFGELLQGSRNERERQIISNYWSNLPKVPVKNLLFKGGVLASEKKLYSRGLGLMDATIMAAALESQSQIWTANRKFKRVLPKYLIYS